MCGIAGACSLDSQPLSHQEALRPMLRMIRHRGPDGEGLFSTPGVQLGMRRLSIIDLVTGDQPIYNEDGSLVLVFNGEIYNYRELRQRLMERGHVLKTQTDTEVVIHLFEEKGPACLGELNGMFAFALYDRRQHQLFLARDRFGKKPLYYAVTGRDLVFASELKSLFRYPGIERRVDRAALDNLLAFNFVPQPDTMYEGIKRLPAGSYLLCQDGKTTQVCYWSLPTDIQPPVDELEAISNIRSILSDAVRIRMRSDVAVGAFLSGGIDSSSVTAYMRQHTSEPFATFSIGFQEDQFSELPYSNLMANLLATEHHTQVMQHSEVFSSLLSVLWHLDMPHGDASFMPTYLVSDLASHFVKVVLTGDGGDELFAGYEKYRSFLGSYAGSDFNYEYYRASSIIDDSLRDAIYTGRFRQSLGDNQPFEVFRQYLEAANTDDLVNRMLYADATLLLEGNNLVKPDRMAMAVSIEPRAPFLDYRLAEYVSRLPGSWKLRGDTLKFILKKAVTGLIPDEVIHRKKQMFTVPIGEWFRSSLRHFIVGLMSQDRTRERGYFEPARIDQLIQDHLEGRANYTRQLRLLMNLELWHRMFMDDLFEGPPSWADLGLETVVPADEKSS